MTDLAEKVAPSGVLEREGSGGGEQAAPSPTWSEAERLDALQRYAILDTGRETAFDEVAALAADLLDAPIAVVNLIAADRQWFKAEVGIGADTLPLDVSICRHAILQPGVFVVPDLTLDSRFDGNPLIHVAGGLRFYAGALLETPEGLPLGTVCVLDTVARPAGLSERQTRALRVLASQTMARLELRRSEAVAKAETARAQKRARRLSLLSEASSLLFRAGDPQTAAPRLFAVLAEEFRLDVTFHYRCEDDALHLVAAAGLTLQEERAAAQIEFGRTVCGIVAATREAAHVTGIRSSDEPHVQFLKGLGLDSYFSAPLLSGDDLLGTLSFGRRGEPFSPGELDALRTLVAQFATVLERQRAEGDLRTLNETLETQVAVRTSQVRFHRDIIEATAAPICAFDPDFRLIAFNKAHNDEFRRVNGFDTRIGDVFPDLFIAEQQPVMRALMARALSGERFTVTQEFGRPELGQPLWEISYTPLRDETGAIIGAFHLATDISDRIRTEIDLAAAQEALRQSQKMEAMGSLTGGVAHDFNNLLTPIVGSLDLLQRRGLGGAREQRLIDGALQSAERAKTLVQRLLAFARRQPLQPEAVDVAALVAGMADLVSSTTGPTVQVEMDIASDLPPAVADANQIEMALLNLAVNARDAMPEGGRLTIAATAETAQDGHRAGLAPGRYVRLSVTDSGEGMDEATLKRAVEPFFSTKGVGKGTGLGLSMVHGLAAQLGGGIAISSTPGLGAQVELWLPASDQAAAAPETREPLPPSATSGTVLLVEDEELVRASTADMLAELGYAVVEASSAEEALRLIDGGFSPDLLVTDHLMPGMSGADLVRRITAARPMRVLVVSGYAEVEGIAPDLPRLVKPFRQADLASAIAALN